MMNKKVLNQCIVNIAIHNINGNIHLVMVTFIFDYDAEL